MEHISKSPIKLMIVGPAQHGKDTVAELLSEYLGLTFMSSSLFCINKFIFDILGPEYGYSLPYHLYENRDFHRTELYNLISDYTKDDLSKLSRELFKEDNIYVGCRNREEFLKSKEESLFHLSIWVDASERKTMEPPTSMTIKKSDADIIIDNNGTLNQLKDKLKSLAEILKYIN